MGASIGCESCYSILNKDEGVREAYVCRLPAEQIISSCCTVSYQAQTIAHKHATKPLPISSPTGHHTLANVNTSSSSDCTISGAISLPSRQQTSVCPRTTPPLQSPILRFQNRLERIVSHPWVQTWEMRECVKCKCDRVSERRAMERMAGIPVIRFPVLVFTEKQRKRSLTSASVDLRSIVCADVEYISITN